MTSMARLDCTCVNHKALGKKNADIEGMVFTEDTNKAYGVCKDCMKWFIKTRQLILSWPDGKEKIPKNIGKAELKGK